jgi:hypothetical protein
MASSLAARLSRLEAKYPEPDPNEELTHEQRHSLILKIDSLLKKTEVSDETLWHAGISRERYEAGLNSISPELWKRLMASWEKKSPQQSWRTV